MNDKTFVLRNGKVTGCEVTQTGPLTLTVAAGNLCDFSRGIDAPFAGGAHTFTPHSAHPTQVYFALVWDGATLELWADEVTKKNKWQRNLDKPSGYERVLELGWGSIPANETDLANADMNRRVYVEGGTL